MDQITIDGKTWCKRDFGWIGPDLKAPGFFLRYRLEKLLKKEKQSKDRRAA